MSVNDLQAVRAACAATRARAWALPEGSAARVLACAELRRLEDQAAAISIVREVVCGACGGGGWIESAMLDELSIPTGRTCSLCHGSGVLEVLEAA